MRIIKSKPRSNFFHVHSHSQFSVLDALPTVKSMVETVAAMGHPALALSDHGNMGGAVQLYKECMKAGIKPFPGSEFYFVPDRDEHRAGGGKRNHLGILAYTSQGYENLVRLSTKSHENFFHKPLIDWSDLAEADLTGLAVTTGCYFGLVVQTLIQHGPNAARGALARLAALFQGSCYVEIQKHNIEQTDGLTEDEIADWLYASAMTMDLPVVITQDSHYCHLEDKHDHEALKRVAAFGPDPDDAVFPGDGFHLCDEAWIRDHHRPLHLEAAQRGFQRLLDSHDLHIGALDKYAYNIPFTVAEPDQALQARAEAGLRGLVNDRDFERYAQRLNTELEIVQETGMAGYLLLVQEVTDWCQANGVFVQARGSASGSMICWALGITQLDPIKYGLRFERFISRDRTKPPDIDLDVEDRARPVLIAWLRQRFNVCSIGTYGSFGLETDKETGEVISEAKGSLIIAYKSVAKKQGVDPEILKNIKGVHDIPEPERSNLIALSARKVKKSVGCHAGGLVITTTADELDRLVPKMWIASSKTMVTQYDMKDVEDLGLVKLDVLGLRTLSLLRSATELLGREVRGRDPLGYVPFGDSRTFTAIRQGANAGVFQLEGWTANRGCTELGVRTLRDIFDVLAVYRPAVIDSGSKKVFIARRRGLVEAPERHPILERELGPTHGLPVYQEQVIAILRNLGLSPEDLTALLKAVKASNENIGDAGKVIASYKELVATHAAEKGVGEADFAFLWQAIEGFAKYGFNLAHASAYGIVSYRSAWLKVHHPLEFACALLTTISPTHDKYPGYVSAVRSEMGIRILRPHVNISGVGFTIDHQRKCLRRGLISVKGVGEKASQVIADNAPYVSITDMVTRLPAKPVTGGKDWAKKGELTGVLKALQEVGALDDLPA